MSCRPFQVQLTVSPLPALAEEDEVLCVFGGSPPHPARVEGEVVTCNSPSSIPSTPPGQGKAPPAALEPVSCPAGCALIPSQASAC